VSWFRWQFATGVVDTSGKFTAGIVDTSCTSGKIAACVIDTRGKFANLSCEYLCELKKKFEMTIMLFLGAWRKVIHEKNLKQKIL